MTLDDYISLHTSPAPAQLAEIERDTYLRHVYPRMCCGHVQGRLLAMLAALARPKRILELGAFTGYATLCLAEGMPPGAELHTVEIDDEKEDELRAAFAASPRGRDIHLHIGDALRVVPALPPGWDLALIDADKRLYPDYFRLLVPRMAPGGLIIADNTLWGGKLTAPGDRPHDPQSLGVMEFNDLAASDPRVETVMLPLRDGLTLIRVKPRDEDASRPPETSSDIPEILSCLPETSSGLSETDNSENIILT